MSQFPRRLIDEPGDSPGRRMLEKARGDAPPAKAVAAAILAATRSAGAATEPNASTNEPPNKTGANGPSDPGAGASRTGSSGTTRTLTSKKLALIATTAIVGTALLWGATHGFEPASNRAPNDPPSTSALSAPGNAAGTGEATANAPTTPSLPAPLAPAPIAEAMPSTSVADLPNANAPATLPHASNTQPPPQASSADLLREANQLRAQNQWDAAAALYEKVITIGPSSAEAYPANVALGNLELQRGRPAAALARYDHALKMQPSGALAEEARWGKARALRTSGRVDAERAALEDFRTHHPESLLAPGAAKRLSEIGN